MCCISVQNVKAFILAVCKCKTLRESVTVEDKPLLWILSESSFKPCSPNAENAYAEENLIRWLVKKGWIGLGGISQVAHVVDTQV